jgi:hypothetical protein
MDCTLTSASATVGTCSAAVCGCDRDEMCLAAGSGLGVCTTGAACSVLADDCPAGYGCDPGSGLCTCDEPGPCGRRCSSNADCVQGRLCIDGRCGAMDCRSDADCPGQAVCGGPLPSRTCVQPGTSADGAICRSWTECKSGYCFAANSCATPCEVTTDCGAGKLCQNADPTTFPGELPVCLAQTTLCDPPCQDDQRCNNDPNNPTCLP